VVHFGTSTANLCKIQQVQNILAKIVLSDSVLISSIALRQLHWLPVTQCIHFKIATLTYRTLQSRSPSYLLSLINFNNPSRPLRSSSLDLLHVPFTPRLLVAKLSGSQLQWFGILFHLTSGYYHPLDLLAMFLTSLQQCL